jgi:hypothetical protein
MPDWSAVDVMLSEGKLPTQGRESSLMTFKDRRMALEAIIDRADVYRVVLEQYPEGVYMLAFATPTSAGPFRDVLQNDLAMAKRASFQDYGITEEMWRHIPDTKFNG